MFSFLTQEIFDTLIIAVMIIGGIWAAVRLYRDFTRPLTPDDLDWLNHDYDDDDPFDWEADPAEAGRNRGA